MATKSTASTDSAALAKAIRMCTESGEIVMGARESMQSVRHGKGQVLVLAANAPADNASDVRRYCALSSLPIVEFAGTSMELGSICGKPFPVSMLLVLDAGNSSIMEMAKKGKA
ncbi:50S ribosomal protein L30e [uncultured archaeon]|nr:50S ribosomal protein L30e [uncultured archaeon]